MIKLIPNWRVVALKSYSMWSIYLGILALFAPEVIYLLGRDTNPAVWWWTALALLVFGAVGRLIVQTKEWAWLRAVILGAIVLIGTLFAFPVMAHASYSEVGADHSDEQFYALAVPKIRRWEGNELVAYLDTIAKPPVVTACSGSTLVAGRPIKLGRVFTQGQCDLLLSYDIRRHRIGLWRLLNDTGKSGMTLTRDVSLTSWVFNIGVTLASKSTAIRRLNRGDVEGACKATGWYNRAGGRVIRGLVLRRQAEVTLCLEGLT
jgi:GH24 family phage-related lysozyme (muramidase)